MAIAGPVTGSLVIDSPDGDAIGAGTTVSTSGTVLRHSNASFSDEYDTNFLVVPLSFESDSGLQPIDIELHNYDWDFLQARLDLDEVEMPQVPFSFLGTLEQGIGFEALSLPFVIDTDGLELEPIGIDHEWK